MKRDEKKKKEFFENLRRFFDLEKLMDQYFYQIEYTPYESQSPPVIFAKLNSFRHQFLWDLRNKVYMELDKFIFNSSLNIESPKERNFIYIMLTMQDINRYNKIDPLCIDEAKKRRNLRTDLSLALHLVSEMQSTDKGTKISFERVESDYYKFFNNKKMMFRYAYGYQNEKEIDRIKIEEKMKFNDIIAYGKNRTKKNNELKKLEKNFQIEKHNVSKINIAVEKNIEKQKSNATSGRIKKS